MIISVIEFWGNLLIADSTASHKTPNKDTWIGDFTNEDTAYCPNYIVRHTKTHTSKLEMLSIQAQWYVRNHYRKVRWIKHICNIVKS